MTSSLPAPPPLPPADAGKVCWIGMLLLALGGIADLCSYFGVVVPYKLAPFLTLCAAAGAYLAHAYCPNAHGGPSAPPPAQNGSTST